MIRGGNAQGKTSVLEAILFVATSKSHRTNQEADLVQHGANGFVLQAAARRRDREVALETTWREGVKRIKVNGVPQTRVSDILGKVHVVLFSTEDVMLVRGGAAQRRRFLDMALSQADAAYLNTLQRFRQALRQRNEVLRSARPDAALLDVWEAQLGPCATALTASRAAFVPQLGARAAALHEQIARGEPLRVSYAPDVGEDEPMADILLKSREIDVRRRVTARGPHRDDIVFSIGGQPARQYASEGQQKTAALALKLAELEWVKERSGEYPILLLDEVLSELDGYRARHLIEAIHRDVQCILTTAQHAPNDGVLDSKWPSYRIERGSLEKD